MVQKTPKRKPSTKRRTAAPARRHSKGKDEAETAVATLMALLHADRWLFEASQLARKGNLAGESERFDSIRLSIVESMNRLQPRAYGAMTRGRYLRMEGI